VAEQIPLFIAGATHTRELAIARSRARREVAVALGQIGDQLAMTLWRTERLARAVERHRECLCCGPDLEHALAAFADAPRGRRPATTRILPVVGWAA
jgi:hypothetical protein